MKFSRVTITGSVYNLFFNLLITPEEELSSTIYFTCETIHESIRKNLVNSIFIPQMFSISRTRKLRYILKYRFLSPMLCPFMNKAKIYAQDHLPFSPIIIGKRQYALTEDGPTGFKAWENQDYVIRAWNNKQFLDKKKGIKKIALNILNPLHGGIFANNNQCNRIILTSSYVPPFAKNKVLDVVNLERLWHNSSQNKREYILKIFNINESDIEILKKAEIIIFTQPFFEDNDVDTIEEQVQLYEQVLKQYIGRNVVIKTHPRETTDYNNYFSDVFVFNKPVPFQLLALMGIRFNEAATICSSSVFGIPYPIKINWIGTRIHPKIFKEYGDFIPNELKIR